MHKIKMCKYIYNFCSLGTIQIFGRYVLDNSFIDSYYMWRFLMIRAIR